MCMSTSELCTLMLYSMEAELQGEPSAKRDKTEQVHHILKTSFLPSAFFNWDLANSKARGDMSPAI